MKEKTMTDYKFKVGDRIRYFDRVFTVKEIEDDKYIFEECSSYNGYNNYVTNLYNFENEAHLVTPLEELL